MCNPLSTDPRHALYPSPPGCSGYRLWRMLHEVSGASRSDYCEGFDRRNLLRGRLWDRPLARTAARRFSSTLSQGTIVVVLGQEVARALGLNWRLMEPQRGAGGCVYRVIPHPSGRCRWYNEPENRLVVGLMLEELLNDQGR